MCLGQVSPCSEKVLVLVKEVKGVGDINIIFAALKLQTVAVLLKCNCFR
jgi:hypothetical protein